MNPWAAETIVQAAGAYVVAGVVFALFFVTLGVGRIDSTARGAPAGFRVLIAPGVAAFWPLLAFRWARGASLPPAERNAHRRAAR